MATGRGLPSDLGKWGAGLARAIIQKLLVEPTVEEESR